MSIPGGDQGSTSPYAQTLIKSPKEESATKLLPFHKHHEEEVEGFVEFYEKLAAAD